MHATAEYSVPPIGSMEGAPSAITRSALIAGVAVQLCFATRQLESRIWPALRRLTSVGDGRPEITIVVYDFASRRIFPHLPAPPVWHDGDYFSGLTRMDESNGRAYWCISDVERLPYIEQASPLRAVLTHVLGQRGRFLAHSAAVSDGGEGVLIVGHGGAGKSTTSLSSLVAGMHFAGDDYCLLSYDGRPHVQSLYATAKLALPGTEVFSSLLPYADAANRPESEKLIFFLEHVPQIKLSTGFPIRAILLPRIKPQRETRICPLPAAKGFLALTPSLAYHAPGLREAAHRCFGQISASIPAYELQLGSHLAGVPDAIRNFLHDRNKH